MRLRAEQKPRINDSSSRRRQRGLLQQRQAAQHLLVEVIDLLVQMADLELGFQVHLVLDVVAHAVASIWYIGQSLCDPSWMRDPFGQLGLLEGRPIEKFECAGIHVERRSTRLLSLQVRTGPGSRHGTIPRLAPLVRGADVSRVARWFGWRLHGTAVVLHEPVANGFPRSIAESSPRRFTTSRRVRARR